MLDGCFRVISYALKAVLFVGFTVNQRRFDENENNFMEKQCSMQQQINQEVIIM